MNANPELPFNDLQFEDAQFISELRDKMFKFARLQLNDEHLAEDAVQEALIGAFKGAKSFEGKAAFKTWVFAILKNKIADILRKRQRLIEASSLVGDDEDEDALQKLFDERGHWYKQSMPSAWSDPEASFNDQQFWRVFEACLERVPAKQAKAFMMREFIGLDSEEICSEMSISVSNLHVTLHRARLRLQQCLQVNWIQGDQHA